MIGNKVLTLHYRIIITVKNIEVAE